MHRNLRGDIRNCQFGMRKIQWHQWYENSFVSNLIRNREDLRARGIDLQQLIQSIEGELEDNAKAEAAVKRAIQRCTLVAIKKRVKPDHQNRLREKYIDGTGAVT